MVPGSLRVQRETSLCLGICGTVDGAVSTATLRYRRRRCALDRVVAERGRPQRLVMDNGPDLTSKALDQWAYAAGVELVFIRPGKPVDNCFVESFNGKLRDECLNADWFTTLDDARRRFDLWRPDYNHGRPHSSLGRRTPAEFAGEAGLRSDKPTSSPPPPPTQDGNSNSAEIQ
jgi:transposase InsO family protein